MNIDITTSADVAGLKPILDKTELFPSEMLDEMISSFLTEEAPDQIWLTCRDADGPVGFCFARLEPLTNGTWNMLALAVDPDRQGTGVGGAIVAELENRLSQKGARVLIAETSGREDFALIWAFYAIQGFDCVSTIPQFWDVGDDKLTYHKELGA